MRSKFTKFLITTALCASASVYASEIAQEMGCENPMSSKKFAVGPIVNTAGIGIEGRLGIQDNLFLRASVRGFTYSEQMGIKGELHFKPKLTLLTVPVMLDYHPIDNSGFYVSGGVAYNGNKLSAKAVPSAPITLYGRTYTTAEIGSVGASLKFGNAVAPIMSIGYDNSLTSDSSVTVNMEIGAMYAGKPKLKVSSTGIVGNALRANGLHDDITREAKSELKKVEKYLKWYPLLGFGVKFNF